MRSLILKCVRAIPRLSKAGTPSHSEGWGGLFKDEQYRLIRSASRASISRASIRWLRVFEQTTPALRAYPSLLRRGLALPVFRQQPRKPVVGLSFRTEPRRDERFARNLSPLRGSSSHWLENPGLTPGARICRRSAALIGCASRDILDGCYPGEAQ
jgi:hypothetical protein